MARVIMGAVAAGVLMLAGCAGGAAPEDKRFPTSGDYPPGVMERISYQAGVEEGWRLSALASGPREDARWRVVVISGTPSWSQYWAPTIAAAPPEMEVVVADRPGFSLSEPREAVPDLSKQAAAMAPLLAAADGRPVLLVGQSFGAPIATLMAAAHPDKVRALVIVSGYFGERGPTARRLFGIGRMVRPLLPHDLRNSITEVSRQPAQLPAVFAALSGLAIPVAMVHGDRDSFIPLGSAQKLAETTGADLTVAPGGDHFLNACCVDTLVAVFGGAIARAQAAPSLAGAGAIR
jgi:pimeloyl-ACP methyl ester carboxylesterase